MLSRTLFAAFLFGALALSWPHLVHHVAWKGYRDMVAEIHEGRFDLGDKEIIAPILSHDLVRNCVVLRDETLLILQFYVTALHAHRAGVNPFFPADDPELTQHREALFALAAQATACAPMDGELWLNLAVVARSLGMDTARVAQFLELSHRYAPHEARVMARRDEVF
ncbi:MAG: hypothetical protein EA339_05930 [Rhodobacteraceae bacterium]|nr:MAG: hypothetical protein EA339_05930 [Paracoccaceae bacterium]